MKRFILLTISIFILNTGLFIPIKNIYAQDLVFTDQIVTSNVLDISDFNEGEYIVFVFSCKNNSQYSGTRVNPVIYFDSPNTNNSISLIEFTDQYVGEGETIVPPTAYTTLEANSITLYYDTQFNPGDEIFFGIEAIATDNYKSGDSLDFTAQCLLDSGNTTYAGSVYYGSLTQNTTTGLVPVYRFWSGPLQKHFYTAISSEKNDVINNYSDVWSLEEHAMNAYRYDTESNNCTDGQEIYRFWSPTLQTHFYAENLEIKNYVERTWPETWSYERVSFCAFYSQESGTVPVHRFWSPTLGAHFYTISEDDMNTIKNNWSDIWTYEGEKFYVFPV